jgi:hypothetical protein
MAMTAVITNGKLKLEIDILKPPRDCKPNQKSGQVENVLIATTGGFQLSDATINGKPVRVNVVAIMKKD